jgi:hypothetical protein
MILHLSHIFLTEGRTFISFPFGRTNSLYRSRPAAGVLFSVHSASPRLAHPTKRMDEPLITDESMYVQNMTTDDELFVAIGYPTSGEVIGRKLHGDVVTRENPDIVHAHLA